MKTPVLHLLKDQERRLLAGHCWVYSNEVDVQSTPLKDFEPGATATIVSHSGRWLGFGHVNPRSLICARLISREPSRPPGSALWIERIKAALALRERLYPDPFYRLVHGEGDGLPGLVVDRYADLLVMQISTAGMERERAGIVTALEQVVRPRAILMRNDIAVRDLEGLEQSVEPLLGNVPETLDLSERGVRYLVSPQTGQKTGWFFDQAENRDRLRRFGPAKRVLDVCCYTGAWGLQAAALGAEQVTCVDNSQTALDRLLENAERNQVANRIHPLRGEAFTTLRSLREAGESFDLVILDPPAFIKRRKDLREGTLAYQRLNRLGLEVLAPGGLLATSSCSFHLSAEALLGCVQAAARRTGRGLQLLASGQQGPDHPIHPAIPETAYLKHFVLRALPFPF
ncbi:class I SAM-dependent rRNA methyltransferase [Thioalkalicoccus limnaeus]|uniref:Class I SAM-dependent rRNA methyltransferase n=1 Tax=Thioalkalicoccus limnaeus TaxID=120681 RepID=A0ABV4BBT7_9GAMM